jgi:hypothetical protein
LDLTIPLALFRHLNMDVNPKPVAIWVPLGNLVGGAVFMALGYWLHGDPVGDRSRSTVGEAVTNLPARSKLRSGRPPGLDVFFGRPRTDGGPDGRGRLS